MAKQMKGLLGEKLGMTQVFDENNRIVPVTVVAAGPCVVTQVRSAEVDGYAAVQIGYGAVAPRRVNKPDSGHFAKAGVTPRRVTVELRTDDATEYTLGQEITAEQLDQAVEIIRQRVDGSGVAEAEIATQSGNNIVVSMPGVPSAQTRELIQTSAQMNFRPVLTTAAAEPGVSVDDDHSANTSNSNRRVM